MLIVICVTMCAVTQVVGLGLIARALGAPQIESKRARRSANIHPTMDSDIGGLV